MYGDLTVPTRPTLIVEGPNPNSGLDYAVPYGATTNYVERWSTDGHSVAATKCRYIEVPDAATPGKHGRGY